MKWFLRLLGVLLLGGFIFLGMLIATDPGDNLRLVESGSSLTIPELNNLGAGETWNFETPVLGEVAVQARLRKLTCSKTGEEPHPRACYLPPTLVSL